MTAPLIRIFLRYLSGFLIAKGILGAEYDLSADPELVTLIGVAIGAITEAFYIAARRLGWAK